MQRQNQLRCKGNWAPCHCSVRGKLGCEGDGTGLRCSVALSSCCWSPCAPQTGVNDCPEARQGRIRARSSAGVNQCLSFNGAASICLRKGCNVGNRDKGTHVLAPYILYNCLNKSTAQNGFAGCWGGAESVPSFHGRFMHLTAESLWQDGAAWVHQLDRCGAQTSAQSPVGFLWALGCARAMSLYLCCSCDPWELEGSQRRSVSWSHNHTFVLLGR